MKKILATSILSPLLVVGLLLTLSPATSHACAVCMGDPNSNATQGVGYAILFLMGVIYMVLGGILGAFIVVGKQRSRAAQAEIESNNS